VLHDRVLPFYEEHNIEIQHLLTDNVTENRACPVGHPFELSLVVLGHSTDRAPAHRHRLAGDQRLLRAFSSHGARDVLQRGIPPARPLELPHAGRPPYQALLEDVEFNGSWVGKCVMTGLNLMPLSH
jgi:hypothetical protein